MNNRFAELRKQLGKFVANFSVEGGDGRDFIFDGDDVAVGMDINTYAEDGSVVPLTDGEYTIKEHEVIVKGGKIETIKESGNLLNVEQEVVVEPEKPAETPETTPESDETIQTYKNTIEQLQNDCRAKDERIAELEAKVKEYENKPLDAPVPQTTQMSAQTTIDETVKGTKFEAACRILGS